MPSKMKPWEFIKKFPSGINTKKDGVYCFSFPDIYVERVVLDSIPRKVFSGELRVIHGSEFTVTWIENTFKTMDFFSSHDSYLVLDSHLIPSSSLSYLEENEIDLGGRALIFSFSKNSKTFEKLEKNLEGEFIKIESPMFWEGEQFFTFFSSCLQYSPSIQVKNFLLSELENDGPSFFNSLSLLRLYGEEVSLDDAKEIINPIRIDQFEFAEIFCHKKFRLFFTKLSAYDGEFDLLRNLFSFMQSHLLKVLDPSYTEKKSRLTKYDKEIVSLSKSWKKSDITRALQMFSEMEIMAKSKDRYLIEFIRLKNLRTF